MAATPWERYERPVEVGGISYLAAVRITAHDGHHPHANLTVTTDVGQLQLQAPIPNLPDWQEALGKVIDSTMLTMAADDSGDPYPNTGRGWQDEDIRQLKALWRQRNQETYRWIGRVLGRRPDAISDRLRVLGLLVSARPTGQPPPTGEPGTTPPSPPPASPSSSTGAAADEAVVEEPPTEWEEPLSDRPPTADPPGSGASDSPPQQEGRRPWGPPFRR